MTRNDPYVASIAGELSLRDSMGHVPAVPTEEGAKVWLVLPTYNEASNLEPVVAAVREHLSQPRRILVVDDSSPDGTGEIAERLAASHQDVSVLHRPRKEGLGPAYIAGFREALAGGADLVVQMDADFSHDPADLPRLLAGASRRRPRARLPLRARWGRGGLGPASAGHQPGRLRLRTGDARRRRSRPHGWLQGVAPRGARGDRPGFDIRLRLRVPGGNQLPRDSRRVSGAGGADRLPGPTRGSVEDDQGHRAGGGVAGARDAAIRVPWRRAEPIPER